MVDNLAILTAVRSRLLGLRFAITNPVTLVGAGNTYTRDAGSFVADGFLPGHEICLVEPDGRLDHTSAAVIKHVTPNRVELLQLASIGQRLNFRLCAGMPRNIAYENIDEDARDPNLLYAEEDYIPGPTRAITIGREDAEIDYEPMYVLRLQGIAGLGVDAIFSMADQILKAFKHGTVVAMLNRLGETEEAKRRPLRVRTAFGPFYGQAVNIEARGPTVPITIPLTIRQPN